MRTRRVAVLAWILGLGTVAVVGGCGTPSSQVPGAASYLGDPGRGAQLIKSYGCGSCHTVPGVTGANALVGPPLTDFGLRSYIAGVLPNNAPNLQHWIQDPQGVVPGNAMPDLGVTQVDARDIAAYLLQLGR